MHLPDKSSQVFVYELSCYGLEFRCCFITFKQFYNDINVAECCYIFQFFVLVIALVFAKKTIFLSFNRRGCFALKINLLINFLKLETI